MRLDRLKTTAFVIVVVGAGGTGTYFLKEIGRFIASLKDRKKNVIVISADGDVYEVKNCDRQACLPEDAGRNKAEVMAEALVDSFGIESISYPHYINSVDDIGNLFNYGAGMLKSKSGMSCYNIIPVLVGCVDNVACRRLMIEYYESAETLAYYDAGNGFADGNVIYAFRQDGTEYSPCFAYYGFEYEDDGTGGKAREEMSCTELNEVAPQHIVTNMTAGLCLLSGVIQLIENGTVTTGMTHFNAFDMSMSHDTPENYGFEVHELKKEAS